MVLMNLFAGQQYGHRHREQTVDTAGGGEDGKIERITLKHRHCECSVVSNPLRPHGYSPPGSSVHRILQARTLEWVALPFFMGSSQPRD